MAMLPVPKIGSGPGFPAGSGATDGANPKTSATAPPGRPLTTTSTPSLYDQAIAQAQAALQAEINPLNQQIGANDATTAQGVNDAIANAQALSEMLKQIAPAISGAYSTASQDQGILGKGFSGAVQDTLTNNAQGIDQTLAGINAPAGQNIDPTQPGKVGDVLYGLGGFIPGSTFAQKGAGYAGAAAMLPATALLTGQANAQQVRLAGAKIDADLNNKIAELAGKLPGDVQTNYMNLQKLALDSAKFNETLKKDNFDQAYKIAQQKLATAKYQTGVNEFNVNTKLKVQSLNLQAQKFAQQTFNQDRNYQLSLARLGISEKSLQLRIAQNEYKIQHNGYSQKDIAKFSLKLDALQANPPTNKNLRTYQAFIAAALRKGVPVSMAIQRANTMFPAQDQNLGPLMSMPSVAKDWAGAVQGSGLSASQAHGVITGSTLGVSPKNGASVTISLPSNLSAKGKAVVTGVLQLAQEYLGTPYAWGGESPTGFDCSGLAQYIYAKEGIQIPRTTYTQFQSGLAVPKNQLQPGDLVFFKGSDSIGGLPGHVGIYIGNGKMIQSPHTGDVVKVSSLSSFPGYMGARRFVH